MEDQEIIEKIEKDCDALSEKIIAKVVRGIFKDLNALDVSMISEDYPEDFKFVDVLSIMSQTRSYEEINWELPGAIENFLDSAYEYLTPCERMVLDLTNVYEYAHQEATTVNQRLREAFGQALNDHYEIRKIQRFEKKCSWN